MSKNINYSSIIQVCLASAEIRRLYLDFISSSFMEGGGLTAESTHHSLIYLLG